MIEFLRDLFRDLPPIPLPLARRCGACNRFASWEKFGLCRKHHSEVVIAQTAQRFACSEPSSDPHTDAGPPAGRERGRSRSVKRRPGGRP